MMKNLRVLHIFNELLPSGAEVMMRCAANEWVKTGVSITILSTGVSVGPYSRELGIAGYPIRHIPFKKSLSFFVELIKLIKGEGFHIVHIHCEQAAFYYALAGKITGTQVVRTIHSSFRFSGFLACRRYIQRKIFHLLKCKQVSIGRSVYDCEVQTFNNRTELINNWYDNTKYRVPTLSERKAARDFYAIPQDVFTIVSVGNCAPVKNHNSILKALALIKDTFDFMYIHVGREEEGYPEQKLATGLGIADKSKFVGPTSDALIPLFAADVFVMPSLHEGLSIAAMEAMAVGVPVILSDVYGLNDFKKIKGTFWSGTDPESLAELLKQVYILSKEAKKDISLSLNKQISQKYGIEKSIRAYVDLYRELTQHL